MYRLYIYVCKYIEIFLLWIIEFIKYKEAQTVETSFFCRINISFHPSALFKIVMYNLGTIFLCQCVSVCHIWGWMEYSGMWKCPKIRRILEWTTCSHENILHVHMKHFSEPFWITFNAHLLHMKFLFFFFFTKQIC